jgi:plastocyanin
LSAVVGCASVAQRPHFRSFEEGREYMNDVRVARPSRRSVTLVVVGTLLATMLATGLTQAASATITMQYYVFSPSPLTIAAGSTVTWVNKDPGPHQVVSDTGAFAKSKVLNTDAKFSVKFSKTGTFNYHDGINDFMRGTIVVIAAPKATPRPTLRPTAKPTVKPTAAPTAAPSVTVEPTATAAGAATPAPTDTGATGSATPDSGASAAPGGSGGDGSSAGSGSGSGSLDIGSILFGLALAVLLFFAWLGVQSFRRNRPGPPTGDGPEASGGPAGSSGSGDSSGPGGSGGQDGSPAVEAAPARVAVSPATRRLARRPSPPEPFDEDAPIGGE